MKLRVEEESEELPSTEGERSFAPKHWLNKRFSDSLADRSAERTVNQHGSISVGGWVDGVCLYLNQFQTNRLSLTREQGSCCCNATRWNQSHLGHVVAPASLLLKSEQIGPAKEPRKAIALNGWIIVGLLLLLLFVCLRYMTWFLRSYEIVRRQKQGFWICCGYQYYLYYCLYWKHF